MARRVALVAAAGAAALALVGQGCARPGEPEAEPTPSATASASASALPTNAPPPPPPPPPNGSGGDGGFAWIPFGPADPEIPMDWYNALEDGDCANVQTNNEDDSLVKALAALCRVVFERNAAQWALVQAQAARPRNDERGPEHECMEKAAEALLQRALAWHANHPGQIPQSALPAAGSSVACGFEVISVERAQGRAGDDVEIKGRGLSEATVFFGDAQAEVAGVEVYEEGGIEFYTLDVIVPQTDRTGPVDVRVRSRVGEIVKPSAFTYLPNGSTPSASDSPEPPTGEPESPPPETPRPESPRPESPRPESPGPQPSPAPEPS